MPYCSKCGKQVLDFTKYCPDCGAKIETETNLFAKYENEEVKKATTEENDPFLHNYSKPVEQTGDLRKINVIKEAISSPVNLILIIALSICLLCNIFALFANSDPFDSIGDLFGLLTSGFVTTGLWIMWGNSKRENGKPQSGIKLIKAGIIIEFVLSLIIISILSIVLFILGISEEYLDSVAGDNSSEIMGIVMGLFIVIIAILYAGTIVLFVSLLKFVNSINEGLDKGNKIIPRRAIFVAILLFILGISIFSNSLNNGVILDIESLIGENSDVEISPNSVNPLKIIGGILESISIIYAGVAILIYRANLLNKQ